LGFLIQFSCTHKHNAETALDDHAGHDHTALTEEDSDHETEQHNHKSITYTQFNKGYELLVEMPNLIVRETADITLHLTRLSDYKPLPTHEIQISLTGTVTYEKDANSHKTGIFHTQLTPKQPGIYSFIVRFNDQQQAHQISIDSLLVYLDHDQIPSSQVHDDNLIIYTKEKSWHEDFAIFKVQAQPFSRVIKTSGEILPAPGDETIITALHSGTISLKNTLIEGRKVNKGDVISVISSDLIHQNLTNDYLEAKNKFEKANLDKNRAEKLIAEKLISEKEFLETKLNYESTKNAFNNISKYYSDGNENVKAGIDGYIRTVFVREGQFIEEGQPIATLIQNKRIVLKAYVPQQYNHLASGFYAANFSPVYTDKLFSTKSLNGQRLSYSSALPANSLFTSVNFEFDANPEIMPGSYCEVYLKSASTKNTLLVPVSSLMEDQGNYFVFVLEDGEHYRKNYITLGNSDGEFVEIIHGLQPNNYVVSKGTYKVFLASLGTSAPAHTHSH